MNTITTPNFMSKTAKIIAEVRARACIDNVDAEVIKEILQDELTECCDLLNQYYEEEYHNALSSALSSARSRAYDDGYSDGYDDGQSDGAV